jgi:predicted transcriptional regulator
MMSNDLLDLTALIVSEYAGNNSISANELPALIQSVYASLAKVDQPAEEVAPAGPVAATTARKSLSNPAHIISMIDGKPYAMLTRHLKGQGYTPQSYRQAVGLPVDYPMTAPAYSEKRRTLAKAIGLGRKKAPEPAPAPKARKPRAPKAAS